MRRVLKMPAELYQRLSTEFILHPGSRTIPVGYDIDLEKELGVEIIPTTLGFDSKLAFR